jgi:MFS transporter, putative metabolite:H+ symporter
MSENNNLRLFYGSCLALITTAFSFSIRAGVLPQLGETFQLSAEQLGFINTMWFVGFPISMVIGGIFYNAIGAKRIMIFAFFAHMLGIILTIYSGGYTGLLISTLFIGLGNGCTEAACNPLIATSYSGKRMNTLLNRFHMWFPGGIVLGALISYFMTGQGFGWEAQMWVIILPTVAYAVTFWGQKFPESGAEVVKQRSGDAKIGSWIGLFIFICVCMSLTAISEFGPGQWASIVLKSSGAEPMLIVALTAGVAAVGRYFGGEFVHKFDQTGVLLASAIVSVIGITMLSMVTGPMAYFAAIVFGMGICYFWPNMIGFTAEKIPASGALGMSIVGAVGMFSTSIWQPVIGIWIDNATAKAKESGLTGDAADLVAGQSALTYMITFPAILVVLFTILYIWMKKSRPATAAAAAH